MAIFLGDVYCSTLSSHSLTIFTATHKTLESRCRSCSAAFRSHPEFDGIPKSLHGRPLHA